MKVEFGILGPLQALVDGTSVSLGGRQQRAVLAILLAQANQTVPVERLIDGIWDDDPPETAANVLQGYVSQLRRLAHHLESIRLEHRAREATKPLVIIDDQDSAAHRSDRRTARQAAHRGKP